MGESLKLLDAKKFDYDSFKSDLSVVLMKKGTTMSKVSTDVCLRSTTYLSNMIRTKRLPANVAIAVAQWAEMDLKKYEIKRVVEKKLVIEQPKEVKEPNKVPESGWACIVKVDEEFGMAMMKIFKDGKEIALGRSYTYGSDDVGVVQGISYAAHMCYKIVQQSKMAQESIKTVVEPEIEEEPEEELEPPSITNGRVIFKDWIKKYEKDNTKAGMLAKFIKSNYQSIPATGKKRIRMYIRLNKGEVHLATFDSMWTMYLKWYDAQYSSLKL